MVYVDRDDNHLDFFCKLPAIESAKVRCIDTKSDTKVESYYEEAFLDFARSTGPYRYKAKGMGTIRAERNASNEEAHSVPSRSYICLAKSGNAAPSTLRKIVDAAKAEAAFAVYASTM